MRSATNSEGPRLVRIAMPCAQIQKAHDWSELQCHVHTAQSAVHFETPAQQATCH